MSLGVLANQAKYEHQKVRTSFLLIIIIIGA